MASKESMLTSTCNDKICDIQRDLDIFLQNNKSISTAERNKIRSIISKTRDLAQFTKTHDPGNFMATDDPGPGLCFGDAILLEVLRRKPAPGCKAKGDYDEWGFLSADITPSGHVGMTKGTVEKPPQDIGECLWTVEPVHQHCAFRELRAYMTEVGDDNSSLALSLQQSWQSSNSAVTDKTRLERALVQEIRFNTKLAERRKGDPIAFGQPVQLQHVKSKRFLALDFEKAPGKDDSLCLRLDAIGSALSGITIRPRFRINTDGEKIESGSQINVVFRHKQETLSAARFSSSLRHRRHHPQATVFAASQQHEYIDSQRMEPNSSLKIHLYARYDASASKSNYVAANDVVRLHNRDNQSLLVGLPEDEHRTGPAYSYNRLALRFMQTTSGKLRQESFKTKGTEAESNTSLASNSLWIIERARAAVGGPCLWHDRFRLLHLNTGKYLSIDDGKRSGEASVLCQSEDRARATLFSFNKLKNEKSGKVDGMQDIIFANQPFLICKEPTANTPAHDKIRGESGAEDGDEPHDSDPSDRSGAWWLSSADEVMSDTKTETGAADSFRGAMFAVHATRGKRMQDAMDLLRVHPEEIDAAMQGLVISRQLGALATRMQEAQYVPCLEDLFAVVANLEEVILFALKTNLPPTTRDTDLSAMHKRGAANNRQHFHECCQDIGHLDQFIHFPDTAHQQVLCEQGVLENVFRILKVMTETLKKLLKRAVTSLESEEKKVCKNLNRLRKSLTARNQDDSEAQHWNTVRKNYPTLVKMAREESKKLRIEDVRALCQLLFLAITAIFSHNPQAEIAASQEMSFILETLLTLPNLGADDCLTRMLDHNEYLLRNKVEKEHVELIVKLLKKDFFLKPGYLSFLEALCSVSDCHAVTKQQNRVFDLFIKEHKNLQFQLRLAPRINKVKSVGGENFFVENNLKSTRHIETGQPQSQMAGSGLKQRRRRNSIHLFNNDQRKLLRQHDGPHQQQIEVTWRVDMPGLPEQIQKASPQELFPMGHQDGGDWWVPLDELKTKTEGFPDAEHDLNESLSNELTEKDLKVLITEYFSNQLKLMCSLCMDRNCLIISAIEKEYTYQLVLAGIVDPSLDWLFRSRFADLMKSLWIDRPPFHILTLPRHIHVGSANSAIASSPSAWSVAKSEFAEFGITNPQKIADNFVVLQFVLISYIKGHAGSLTSAKGPQNIFTSFCISLLSDLIRHGFFSAVKQQNALLNPVLSLLNGTTDQIEDVVGKMLSERQSLKTSHSLFEAAVHGALARAQTKPYGNFRGTKRQPAPQPADHQVAAESLPSEKAVDTNSMRGMVGRIIKSKAYSIFIIAAVPLSVVPGALELLVVNSGSPAVFAVNPSWVVDNAYFWQFVYWLDVSFIFLFLADVEMRVFSMGLSNYLMHCSSWLDLLVSLLDIAALIILTYMPAGLSVVGSLIPGLRGARFIRVIIRSVRFIRMGKSVKNLEDRIIRHKSQKRIHGVNKRFKDCVETESINRIKVALLKLLRSLLTTRLDRVLCIYLSDVKLASQVPKSEIFFKIFARETTPQTHTELDQKSSITRPKQKSGNIVPGKRQSSVVVPLETTLLGNFGQAGVTLSENELHWDIPKINAILCDLMMYESTQISSAAFQVLVMLHAQASRFVEELDNSYLLTDVESGMFHDMADHANVVSFALESFEVWSTSEDKASATGRRVLEAIESLNQQNANDTTRVLRRGLRRLGLIPTIVHEILERLNNTNGWTLTSESTSGQKERIQDPIFAAVCTFLVSFVRNDLENKNLIAGTPHCLQYFSHSLQNITHTATCCDVLAALFHHNIKLCNSLWASRLVVKSVYCLVGPLRDLANTPNHYAPALWTTTTKLLSLLIELTLCDSVGLKKNQAQMIKTMLGATISTADSLNWCTNLECFQQQKQSPEAQAAFMQFLRLVNICCACAKKDPMRNMCARLCARLFSLRALFDAYAAPTLPYSLQFMVCEAIRHFVSACEADPQLLPPIKKLKVSHIKLWIDKSTCLIECLVSEKPTSDETDIASRIQCIPEGQDRLRNELFGAAFSENVDSDGKIPLYDGFIHIAFQVLPITEIILRGGLMSESIRGLEESVRAFVRALNPLAMHIHRFWGHFRNDTLRAFYQQLSLFLSSLVPLPSKLAWAPDLIPRDLEGYVHRDDFMEVTNSESMEVTNSERKVSTTRNRASLTFCWGVYTSASVKHSSEYTALQPFETARGRSRAMSISETSFHFCKSEAQALRQDKAIFEYLKSQKKTVVQAMDQNDDHKLRTLFERLIHISSVQLENVSRLNQTHISIIIEVIKVVQQYLGDVEDGGNKEVTPKQRLLVEVGTLELLIRLMSWIELPRKLLLEILDLGCNILAVAGGYEDAQRRVYTFLCKPTSHSFFLFMEHQFKLSSQKLSGLYSVHGGSKGAAFVAVAPVTSDLESKQSPKESKTTFGEAPKGLSVQDPGNRKLFRFWEWLCEGLYQPNQHLLRAQPQNPRSINLLTLAASFLSEIAERNLGQIEYLLVAISLYNFFCESIQGACLENQQCLALDTDLLDISNSILQQLNVIFKRSGSQVPGAKDSPMLNDVEDLIEDLVGEVVELLDSLLERAVDGSIAQRVYAVIKPEPLLFRMKLIHQKVETLKTKRQNFIHQNVEQTQDTQLVEEEIAEVRVLGAKIMKFILTISHWVPDWFHRIKMSRTNRELLSWFQEDMAVVEIDWNGCHVMQWFFDPGYELQMSQDEIIAAVSATTEDTHVEKLAKFVRTVEVLHTEFKQQQNILPKASASGLQSMVFFLSVLVNLVLELGAVESVMSPDDPSVLGQDYDFSYEFVVGNYFEERQLLTQTGLKTIRYVAIGLQIALLVIHITLLVAAKRSVLCRDLGEGKNHTHHTGPVDMDFKELIDENDAPEKEDNPPKKCCQRIYIACVSDHNRVRTAVYTLSMRIFFLLCAIISIWRPYMQCLILFDVVLIWPRLMVVTEALFTAIPKVASSFVLLFVIIFAIAKYQFFYLRQYFAEGACDSITACFASSWRMALTGDFGVLTQYDPAREHADWVLINIIITCSFIIIVNVLFMNVILGTIISVFTKLHAQKSLAAKRKMNMCYICSVSRRQMEKITTVNGFDQHKQHRHNLLSYVQFIFYIRNKSRNQLTGAEQYVLQQLERLETSWFPKSQHVLISGKKRKNSTLLRR